MDAREERERARIRWKDVWDDEENYWAADEAVRALERLGWTVDYEQVSMCAGVFTIRPG